MDNIVILRNMLLVSLLAMLVFIMYKRMLALFRRQHVQAKYPALDASCSWNDKTVKLGLTLKNEMEVNVVVINDQEQIVETLNDNKCSIGYHEWEFNCGHVQQGKYAFQVTTPHEKAIRYFNVP
jgi:hypothetical protein